MSISQPQGDPEMGALVATAQDDMARLIQRGGLQNDPLRHPIQALALALDVQHKLMTGFASRIEQAATAISAEDMRRAVTDGVSGHATAMVKTLSWGVWTGAAAVLLFGMAISVAVGYWQGHQAGVAEGSALGMKASATLATLPRADAATWAQLIRDNLAPAKQLAEACKATGAWQNGRLKCEMPVWIQAGPAPNASR